MGIGPVCPENLRFRDTFDAPFSVPMHDRNLRDLPVLTPICYQREVHPIVVQCKINACLLFAGPNGLQDLEGCHIDHHDLRAVRHLALLKKRCVKHGHWYGGKATIGTEFGLAWKLKPADVMRSFREVYLAKRAS